MLWMDLLFVVLFALILSLVLTWGFGWRHPAAAETFAVSIAFLFFILLFTTWAAVAWLPPKGPHWHGTPWLTLLLVGLIVALLVMAVAKPARRPRTPTREAAEAREEAITATAFGAFFWILLAALLLVIAVGYFV